MINKVNLIPNYILTLPLVKMFNIINILGWPSKTDFAPVCGNSYKPKSLKFRLRANAEILHSVRYDLVVVVNIIGSSKKFLYRMVRF